MNEPTTPKTPVSKIKYFLDTEFIEDGNTIDLISIGIVCEDGRTFYRQNSECGFTKASDWVWRNVLPHLAHFNMCGRRSCQPYRRSRDSGMGMEELTNCADTSEAPCPWATHREIRDAVLAFCNPGKYGQPEFWGYYADYDWVAFCQLFGTMMDLPKGFPMYCRDLKQLVGDFPLPKPDVEIHHALVDAERVKESYGIFTGAQLQPSFQDRVRAEKAELDEKVDKLCAFTNGTIFDNLPVEERTRLLRQRNTMMTYSQILGERIKAFK